MGLIDEVYTEYGSECAAPLGNKPTSDLAYVCAPTSTNKKTEVAAANATATRTPREEKVRSPLPPICTVCNTCGGEFPEHWATLRTDNWLEFDSQCQDSPSGGKYERNDNAYICCDSSS